ncbi:MAG: hypothetical protein EP315_06375 [Gammaproteobacteria bacterium]|nr:MAG: hypothetical protein EP315_06375 [Gammaproteobacteria bacterium]
MFKRISIVLCLLFLPVSAHACWTVQERAEIDGFAEMEDILILSFKDAVSCKPIANASVLIGELEYRTDELGYVQLPMTSFAEMMDARAPLKVSKQGYITLNTELIVAAGTVLNRKQVLSPALGAGKMRFVLQWDDQPEDLDLHLKGPGFHISYRNMRDAPNKARLDRDEMHGYGPETITVDRIENNSVYSLWVDNYSNDDFIQGREEVFIYSGDQLVRKLTLPRSTKRGVHVLDIQNGDVQFVNQSSERP